MQAVNYPATAAAPTTGNVEPDPMTALEPTRNRRPPVRVVAIAGIALSLVLAGFLIGSLLFSRPAVTSPPDPGLGGFAEMYISTLLTQAGEGAGDVLVPYLGYPPDLTGLVPGSWYVTQTGVWSIEEAGPDTWTVLVAATQLGLQEGGYAAAGTHFYEVNVEQTPGGLRAATLPALVARPSATTQRVPGAPEIDASLADAVAEFLTAHFIDAATSPFDTAPFDTVIVRSIITEEVDGNVLEVGVEFLGLDAAGLATPLAYRLQVSAIDWSIIESEDVNRRSS